MAAPSPVVYSPADIGAGAPAVASTSPRPRRIRATKTTAGEVSTLTSKQSYDASLYIPLIRSDVTDKMIFQTLRKMNIGFIGKITLTAGGYVRGGHSFSRATIPIRWNTSEECANFRNQLASQPHVRVFYSQEPPLFWKVSLLRQGTPVKTLANGGGSGATHSASYGSQPSRYSRQQSRTDSSRQTNTSALYNLLNAALARIIALEQRINENATTPPSFSADPLDVESHTEGKDDELSVDGRESIVEEDETGATSA